MTVAGKYCPICGSTGEKYGMKDGCEIRLCGCNGKCLLSWQYKDVSEYNNIYQTTYHTAEQALHNGQSFLDKDIDFLAAAQHRILLLNAFFPEHDKVRLLDIGAGTGAFVSIATVHNYDALGLEPCESLVEYARQLNRNIIVGDSNDLSGQWDIITLYDVLEHLVDPILFLQTVKKHLSPKSLLVLELPEYDCDQSKEQGMDWRHIKPLEHLWLPDDYMLQQVLSRSGYRIVAIHRPIMAQLGKITYYVRSTDA